MTVILVEGRAFEFDAPWIPLDPERDNTYKRYSNWAFAVLAEKKPAEVWSRPLGQTVVDVIALGVDELALVEMKDYRVGATVVPLHVADVVARKVRDTLAYMAMCAVTSAGEDGVKYKTALLHQQCSAYLDIEWPPPASPLAPPPAAIRASVQQQLNVAFNHSGINAHVVDTATRQSWRPKDVP